MQLVQHNSHTLGWLHTWFRIIMFVLSCSSELWVLACMPSAFPSHNIPQVYLCGIMIMLCFGRSRPARSWNPHLRIRMGIRNDAVAFLNQRVQLKRTPFPDFWVKLVKFWRNCCLVKMSLIPWSSSKVNVSCKSSCLMEIKLLLRVHRWILYKFSSESWKC